MKRFILAITGASGALFGRLALEILHGMADVETHLVVSDAARETIRRELAMEAEALHGLADRVHAFDEIAAPPASGSFPACGMLIAPCSVHTLSAIAYGQTGNLVTRAADVMLKERRPLVLMLRESPLHVGHIRAMLAVSEAGAIVAPPVPALYAAPRCIEDMARQTAARALELAGIANDHVSRWGA